MLLLATSSPAIAKNRLQEDFIEKALPEAYQLLNLGHTMILRTHLFEESLIDEAPPAYTPRIEIIRKGFLLFILMFSTQITAIVIWLLRTLWLLDYYRPAIIIKRKWYIFTWAKEI